MEIDREFLERIERTFGEALGALRADIKAGFAGLSSRVDGTNARLDQTNIRLDQTNIRLDASINMVRDFRKDVSAKFDEVGVYLRAINGNVLQHEERIKSLEVRVDKLERTG